MPAGCSFLHSSFYSSGKAIVTFFSLVRRVLLWCNFLISCFAVHGCNFFHGKICKLLHFRFDEGGMVFILVE